MKFKLYHYWRSSCSWRVRWALQLKEIECEFEAINLLKSEQKSPAHIQRNPLGGIPTLEINELHHQFFLSESLPIMEWLEETFPQAHSLLPGNSFERAKIRQLSEMINSGTHPIQNLSVLNHYSENPEEKKKWAQHWIKKGLLAFEAALNETSGSFCVGNTLTMADLCLIPQVYNANRFEVDLQECRKILEITQRASQTLSYKNSEPSVFEPKN